MIIRLKHFNDSLNIVVILALELAGHQVFAAKCAESFFYIYGTKLNKGHFSL